MADQVLVPAGEDLLHAEQVLELVGMMEVVQVTLEFLQEMVLELHEEVREVVVAVPVVPPVRVTLEFLQQMAPIVGPELDEEVQEAVVAVQVPEPELERQLEVEETYKVLFCLFLDHLLWQSLFLWKSQLKPLRLYSHPVPDRTHLKN